MPRPLVCLASLGLACTAAPHGVKWVNAAPGAKDVAAMVRLAETQAKDEHRRLIVYVGATWCHPCQVIHEAAASGKLDAEFPDVEFLAFDLDRDGEALARAGYGSDLIPLFDIPGPDGRAGARREQGGIKGPGNLEYLRAKLHRLLAP